MASHLAPYSKRPLSRITENDVKKIHREVTVSSPALADLAMRFLRALFNFARYEYRGLNSAFLFEHNPVQILNHQRLWNNVARRHTRLTQGQLPGWFAGVQGVREQGGQFVVSVCDMVEMAVLTGLRRGELISLTWDHVSMAEGTYYLSTTKNGDPLELPLTNYVRSTFERRMKQGYDSAYVFSAPNKYGQIKEPKKVIAQIVDKSGVEFTLHDLRRTFTTTAEGLNVGTYTIKRLLNHRTGRDDVTAGYIVQTPEELREPAQRIEDAILQQAEIVMSKDMDAELADIVSGLSEAKKRELIVALTGKSPAEEVG